MDVGLDPSTVGAVTWKLNVYDPCTGEVREGGDVTIPAEAGAGRCSTVSWTTLPDASALGIAAITSAPAVAASEPLFVPAENAVCDERRRRTLLGGERESDPWIVAAAVVLAVLGLLNLVATGSRRRRSPRVVHGDRPRGDVGGRPHAGELPGPFGWATLGVSAVLLAAVPFAGMATKGAQRWLDFGVITIQPSELAKLALVLVPAGILAAGLHAGRFLATLAIAAVPVALVALQPDLSTAVVLVATAGFMLVLARVPLLPLIPLFAAGIVSLPLAVLFLRPYQLERVQVFLSSDADTAGVGWAELQANIAIGSGGLWGLARDPVYDVRAEYLPESEHDLAFASLVYGWGLVAGLAVMVATPVIVWRAVLAARTARTREAALVAAGIGALFGFHALLSIGASLSLLPHAGMPIPLFSYGGTASIVGFAAIGLVLAVRRDGVARPLWASEPPPRRRPRGRQAGALALTASLVAMSVFAWQLQHDRGTEFRAMSDTSRSCAAFACLPNEDSILDRNGVPLVENVPEYTIRWSPRCSTRTATARGARLAGLLATSPNELTKLWRTAAKGSCRPSWARFRPIRPVAIIDAHLPASSWSPPVAALSVRHHARLRPRARRCRRPRRHGTLAAPRARVEGRPAGLEKQYDALLRGTDGKQCVYVSPSGRPVATGERVDPIPGHDLRLHLDLGMHILATDALAEAVRTSKATSVPRS